MVDRSPDDDDNQAYDKDGYTLSIVEDNLNNKVPSSVVFDPVNHSSLDHWNKLEMARKKLRS